MQGLVDIGTPSCIPALEEFLNSKVPNVAPNAKNTIQTIKLKTKMGLFVIPHFSKEDHQRLNLLTREAALPRGFDDADTEEHAKAAKVLVLIGKPIVNYIRRHLPSTAHGDHPRTGPDYIVTKRASILLARIGEPAIPGLIDALLEYPGHPQRHVARALRSITGKDYGQSFEKWRTWYVNRN